MMNFKTKSTSGWMLCPSKSFPGRFYYFNGLTGETAWSGEIDNKTERRDNSQHVADKFHSYPEPNSPPADFVTSNTSTSSYFNLLNQPITPRHTSPTNNQVLYPRCVMNQQFLPNIIWTPVQMAPVLLPPTFHADKRSRTFNQSTQTWDNINSPINTYKTNPNIPPSFSNKNVKHISPINNNFDNNLNIPHKQIKKRPFHSPDFSKLEYDEPLSKKISSLPKTNNLTDINVGKYGAMKPQLKKRIHSYSDSTNATYDEPIQITKTVFDNVENSKQLDYTDLRHVLVARRRKSVNLEDLCQTPSFKLPNQSAYDEGKKKVTFNLNELDDEEIMNMSTPGDDSSTPILDIKYLSQLSDLSMKKDKWYLLPDLEVLLHHFDFIKLFVQSDQRCRIYMPSTIYNTVKTQSIGDCRGRPETMIARQLLRNITNTGDLVVVQDQESKIVCTNVADDILSCCILLLQQKYHVVLITIDENLNSKAKSLYLNSYTINELKENQNSKLPVFDLKKIYSTSQSRFIKSDQGKTHSPKNMQNKNTYQTFNLSNNKNPITRINTEKQNNVNSQKDILKCNQILKHPDLSTEIDTNVQKLNTKVKTDSLYQSIAKNETKEAFIYDISNTESDISSQFDFSNENEDECKLDGSITNNLSESIANTKNKTKQASIFDISNSECSQSRQINKVIDNKKENFSNGYCIEGGLKKFCIKNKIIEERVRCRMEEWECTLIQIMEDTLTDVLRENCKYKTLKTPPPWTLLEAIDHIKQLYSQGHLVKYMADTLYGTLLNISQTYGKLKYAEPTDFMRVFGYCVLLIEALQSVHPTMPTLKTAEDMILDLLKLINNPSLDLDERTLISSDSNSISHRNDDSMDEATFTSANCIKKPKEVVENLVQNNPQRKTCAEQIKNNNHSSEVQPQQKYKIICTVGRDLKFIKITNNNKMTQDLNKNYTIVDLADVANKSKPQNEYSDNNEENGHLNMKIKDFLMILSRFLNMLYDYIYSLITEQCKTKNETNVAEESDQMYSLVIPIIDHLKTIILRESVAGSTENSVLVKAGLDANKYRELVTKCLEQTMILEQFLRLLQRKVKFEDMQLPNVC